MWNGFSWVWLLIICVTVSSIVSTWIRAKHGYPLERGRRRGGLRPPSEEPKRMVEEALAARDAQIAALEERIRVLERIVTDDSSRLREEIDRLAG